MKVVVLSGGVGGARFIRGLLHHLEQVPTPPHEVTVIANTGDDITLYGLRVCPDIDTILYTLGGSVHEEQGWGRAGESTRVQAELTAYGATPTWFTLGDLDLGAHIARSQWLGQGMPLSEVTARLAHRWGLPQRGVQVLPMTDTPVETHVVVDDGERRAIHFQQWWVEHHAALPAEQFIVAGLDQASPAPGVLDALRTADLILLPPSNPVVSIGIILMIPGIRDALRGSTARVVGVSPLIGGAAVRGYADACLKAIGVDCTTAAVGGLYADFLDAWLVDPIDAGVKVPRVAVHAHSEPLLMTDIEAASRIAAAAMALGLQDSAPR